jgi:hypothetical protein
MPLVFRVHPVLINFAEEFRAVCVRLMAYACGVGALAVIAADLVSGAAIDAVASSVPSRNRDAWIAAVRPQPAFAAPVADFASQSESYEILRHPAGGRKDILRWSAALTETPLSQIELYRPGAELTAFGPVASEIAARIAHGRAEAIQAAGVTRRNSGPWHWSDSPALPAASLASASRTISSSRACRSAAGPVRATTRRRSARRWPARWIA